VKLFFFFKLFCSAFCCFQIPWISLCRSLHQRHLCLWPRGFAVDYWVTSFVCQQIWACNISTRHGLPRETLQA